MITTIRVEQGGQVKRMPLKVAVLRFGGVAELAEALEGYHESAVFAEDEDGLTVHYKATVAAIEYGVQHATGS